MASKVEIIGGAPTVDLGVRNFSAEMENLGLLSWCSFDSSVATIEGGRITEVLPRAGMHGLIKTADSAGPQPVTRLGYGGGKMVDETLCYLYSPAQIDEADFTIAMIWYMDAHSAAGQDLLSCYGGGSALRLWQLGSKVDCRFQSTTLIAGTDDVNQPGVFLSIMSASDGTVRLRTRSPTFTENVLTAARTPTLGSNCRAVFGSDEIADGASGANPSITRSMKDTVLDTFVFGRDIMSDPGDPALALIDQYFSEVYTNG